MGHTQMKRVKSKLFKYSNISMDHLSLFAWSHAFIYMVFTCFIYIFVLYCYKLQCCLPVTHHSLPMPMPPTSVAHCSYAHQQ